jgi:septal ring factor EnvC (AmiA/AmiB activator)
LASRIRRRGNAREELQPFAVCVPLIAVLAFFPPSRLRARAGRKPVTANQMKPEKSAPAENAAALKALRSQIAATKIEASRTEDAARAAKAHLKQAKKACKQAKKAAKRARKELKSLLATLAAATPAKRKKQRPRLKKLVPRNANVVATLPAEPTAALPATIPPAANPASAEPSRLPPPVANPA